MPYVPSQLREAYKAAKKANWVVLHDGNDHLEWQNPDGRKFTTTSSNIGNRRTEMNYLLGLRRIGLDIPSQRRPPKKKGKVAVRAAA